MCVSAHWLPRGTTNLAGKPRNSSSCFFAHIRISKNNKSMHAVCHLEYVDDVDSKLG